MAITNFTPQGVKAASCPANKAKANIRDSHCKGLMLEVRNSGGKTYYLCYQDKRGKARQLKLGDVRDISLAQARQLADKYRCQIAMGEDVAKQKEQAKKVPTVAAFIQDSYIPFVKTYKRSWMTDQGLLKNHILPAWGDRHMDEIKKADIVNLITAHRETHAPGSCNRLIILLRYVFNLALRWEVPGVAKNPTADYPLMEENNKNERYLDKEEASRLYEAVSESENEMLKYIIPMLILTGARKREVLDATWNDFDIERRTWRIPLCKLGKKRYVPLSDGALNILSTVPRMKDCPYPFANPKTGKPYVSIFYAWNTARTKAGLPEVRIHDLRHSFASFLVNAGRSLYEVQKILGHTQMRTTQRYAHLNQDSLLSAANVVALSMPLTALPAPPQPAG